MSYIIDYGRSEPGLWGNGFALASVAVNGLPIIWGAITGLLKKRVNVDELVSLAIIASLASGQFLAAAVVSFVMKIGGLIEEVCSESARKAIQSLIRVSPETATVLSGDGEREVPVEQVSVGDVILIKPGDRIPGDAAILSGLSAIDESTMTGESLPVEKGEGEAVLAGTEHQRRAQGPGDPDRSGNHLGKVIRLVSEAEAHRPESIRLIDRYARWFTRPSWPAPSWPES